MTDHYQLNLDNTGPEAHGNNESLIEDTHSLTASLMEHYLEQNGRRYHTYFGPDKNPMPSDAEQERLDIMHEALYLATGSRFHQAPVTRDTRIQNVLDLGTGTGIWAIDFAQENPHANVIGLELTPIQPGWVPPNCRFEIDDFELEWTFKQRFDYIHARMICQSVNDWPRLMAEIWRNMNSGGWVELAEGQFELRSDDNSMPADYPPKVAFDMINAGVTASGRTNPTREKLLAFVQDAGFINIHVKTYKIPTGSWPKDPSLKQAGALATHASQTGYEAYLLALGTRVLGYPEQDVLDLCRKCHEAHTNRELKVHAYFRFHVVYGQKPVNSE